MYIRRSVRKNEYDSEEKIRFIVTGLNVVNSELAFLM